MKITITRYITAVNETDPIKGNHPRYNLVYSQLEGTEQNYPDLSELGVIKRLSEILEFVTPEVANEKST